MSRDAISTQFLSLPMGEEIFGRPTLYMKHLLNFLAFPNCLNMKHRLRFFPFHRFGLHDQHLIIIVFEERSVYICLSTCPAPCLSA